MGADNKELTVGTWSSVQQEAVHFGTARGTHIITKTWLLPCIHGHVVGSRVEL